MSSKYTKIYWDTSCFLCFLNKKEKKRRDICEDILTHAQAGDIKYIITLNNWGFGQSQTDAMLDFMRGVIDTYELLVDKPLGPYMEIILKRVKTYIEPRKR